MAAWRALKKNGREKIMRLLTIICAALMALATTAAGAAEANRASANAIMPGCHSALNSKSFDNIYGQGLCMGLVTGIGRTMEAVAAGLRLQPDPVLNLICADVPVGVTNGQMLRVVIAYIDARPTRMHENFNDLALEALSDAWPCSR
jgi:hypothetical protein